jgi:hypothetical protein
VTQVEVAEAKAAAARANEEAAHAKAEQERLREELNAVRMQEVRRDLA